MTPELAPFSDWVLALLPRLFIYPGGLWMLLGVLLVRLAGGGLSAIKARAWLDDLLHADMRSLAVAWATLALLPLPGAPPLPTPVDRWALAALLALSLLLESRARMPERAKLVQTGAASTLAILAPLAAGTSLASLPADYLSNMPWAFGLSVAAVALGLAIMLIEGGVGFAGDVRGLAWLALALLPLFGSGDMWPNVTVWVFGTAILVWFGAGRIGPIMHGNGQMLNIAQATLWLLGFLALAGPLLAGR